MKKTHFFESVFTETSIEQMEAVLYQAMFDEVIRLRKCRSRRERNDIRKFLIETYQLFAEKTLQSEHPDIIPESTMLQMKQTSIKNELKM